MKTLEAKPTEYKGIRFRSKSEAILAAAFDEAGALWEYEPQWPALTGWAFTPDFLICSRAQDGRIGATIIEYKPSPPTETYLAGVHGDMLAFADSAAYTDALVVVGSPYRSQFEDGFVRWYALRPENEGWRRHDWDAVGTMARNAAKTKRFDLK